MMREMTKKIHSPNSQPSATLILKNKNNLKYLRSQEDVLKREGLIELLPGGSSLVNKLVRNNSNTQQYTSK